MDLSLPSVNAPCVADNAAQCLIAAIQDGLPLTARPYADIGARIGLSEEDVIARIAALQTHGTIKRLGVVVRHHELGYRANAMVVWDVPDERVAALGRCLGGFDFVTLCYRRPRRLPDWPYNLFCMIHGQDRQAVLDQVAFLVARCALHDIPHRALFSKRRFKQRGAVYHTVARDERSESQPADTDSET